MNSLQPLQDKDTTLYTGIAASCLIHIIFIYCAYQVGDALLQSSKAAAKAKAENQVFMVTIEDDESQNETTQTNESENVTDDKDALALKKTAVVQKHTSSHSSSSSASMQNADIPTEGTAEKTNERTYEQLVTEHLIKNKRYPKRAKERGVEGQVSVALTIGHEGTVENIEVLQSDSPLLSDGVESMIRSAAPFPAFIPSMNSSPVTFEVPLRFNLVTEK